MPVFPNFSGSPNTGLCPCWEAGRECFLFWMDDQCRCRLADRLLQHTETAFIGGGQGTAKPSDCSGCFAVWQFEHAANFADDPSLGGDSSDFGDCWCTELGSMVHSGLHLHLHCCLCMVKLCPTSCSFQEGHLA